MAACTLACALWLGGTVLGATPPSASTPGLAPAPVAAQRVQDLGSLPIRRLPVCFPWFPACGDDDGEEDGEQPSGVAEPKAQPASAPERSTGDSGDDPVPPLEPPLEDFRVRIVSPVAGQTVSGRVSVAAEVIADRPTSVRGVDFIVDGRMLFSDVEPPYELLWNAGEPAVHRIEVQAWGPGRQMVHDALGTGAPGPGGAAGVAYSARVERVEIHVRVEGPASDRVPASPEAFTVMEEGRPQPVMAVERVSELPVAVGMVVDHSGSMIERLRRAREAAGEFIDGLIEHPNDKAFLMAFADVPVLIQAFTNDIERLQESFSLIRQGRFTELYDAIAAAAGRFAGVDGRRAVVVLTDGADQGSELDLDQAIAAAQRADVAIYPVAVEVEPRFIREWWVMRRLALETGGLFFGLGRRDDPADVYEAIAEDLRSQYRITYAPVRPGGSGEWRAVVVELAEGLEEEDLEIRARPGYYAR